MFDPQHREEYVDYLEKVGNYEEAALQLAKCVNDDEFVSPKGNSKHHMWMRLCDLCAKYPNEVSRSLKVDAIIRSGLARFTDEVLSYMYVFVPLLHAYSLLSLSLLLLLLLLLHFFFSHTHIFPFTLSLSFLFFLYTPLGFISSHPFPLTHLSLSYSRWVGYGVSWQTITSVVVCSRELATSMKKGSVV